MDMSCEQEREQMSSEVGTWTWTWTWTWRLKRWQRSNVENPRPALCGIGHPKSSVKSVTKSPVFLCLEFACKSAPMWDSHCWLHGYRSPPVAGNNGPMPQGEPAVTAVFRKPKTGLVPASCTKAGRAKPTRMALGQGGWTATTGFLAMGKCVGLHPTRRWHSGVADRNRKVSRNRNLAIERRLSEHREVRPKT